MTGLDTILHAIDEETRETCETIRQEYRQKASEIEQEAKKQEEKLRRESELRKTRLQEDAKTRADLGRRPCPPPGYADAKTNDYSAND